MSEVITLMMVTYNRLNLTKQTLDNIISNTDLPYNLVIIDNASSDGTVDFLKSFKESGLMQKLIIIYNDVNKGIAIGRNQGLLEANKLNTDWYSTIDNDVLLPNGWISQCINILKNNKDYGMVGVNFESSVFPVIEKNGISFQSKPNGNLGTACTVFNKTFHKMVGYFNIEYGLYGEEDADMGARARAMGFKLGYLLQNGVHLGEGNNDIGEYRKFKTESHKRNLKHFNENARNYFTRKKPLYIPCKVDDDKSK